MLVCVFVCSWSQSDVMVVFVFDCYMAGAIEVW